MRVPGMVVLTALAALAIAAACKTSTAGGRAAGAADGGMGSGIEGEGAAADAGVAAAGAVADAGAAVEAAKEETAETAMTAAEAARRAALEAADAGPRAQGAATEALKPSLPAPAPANDAQMVALLHAANQGEILASQLAKTRSRNAKVKAFARRMVKDHGALDARGEKLGIAPEESESSRALTQGAQEALTRLTPLRGKEFDTAYLENQVAAHEQLLESLDRALLPNARNPKLKAFLESARARVKQHLDDARQLQATLST